MNQVVIARRHVLRISIVLTGLSHDSRTGRFCYGDAPTIADICLVAHLTSAKMLYDCDLAHYPSARRIFETCMQIDAFAHAHPLRQPDAPRTIR
jgi:maleylacetoacetate isomerase